MNDALFARIEQIWTMGYKQRQHSSDPSESSVFAELGAWLIFQCVPLKGDTFIIEYEGIRMLFQCTDLGLDPKSVPQRIPVLSFVKMV